MSEAIRDKQCPIAFDHESKTHGDQWPEVFRDLRERCPIAWTENHGGFWIATRYDDITAMAQDTATFSSFKAFDTKSGVVTGGVAIPPVPVPRGLPVESDRPEWETYRTYLNKKFGPKAAEARRPRVKQFANALLDRVIESGAMDIVNDLAGPLPAMTTMELMGLPLEEWHQFADPLHELAYTSADSPHYPQVVKNVAWIFQRCAEEFARQRSEPAHDGLLSYFGHQAIDGRYLSEGEVISLCTNIIVGGVDTTTALTTNALIYLNDHPEQKKRLIDDPRLIPVAREEFLRYFTPIHGVGRNVTRDINMSQVDMQRGDRVFLAWAAGNRDPKVFNEPEQINITRFPNRHIAFGAGIHRCIGSFLARIMFEEMLAAVLTRAPNYRVCIERARKYPSVGVINGWISVPTTFPISERIGGELAL